MRTRQTRASLEKKRLAWGAIRWLHKVKGLTLTEIDEVTDQPRSTASRLHTKGTVGEEKADIMIDAAEAYMGTTEDFAQVYADAKENDAVPFALLREGRKDEVAPPTNRTSGDMLTFLQKTSDSMEDLEDDIRTRADVANPLVAVGLVRMADEIMEIRQKYLSDYVR